VVARYLITRDAEVDRISGEARRANGRAPDSRVAPELRTEGLVLERGLSVGRKNPRGT
jgi:hypothetical protein